MTQHKSTAGKLLVSAVLTALTGSVSAQPPAENAVEAPRTPTPRLADGAVDLGGNGVWDLPYIVDFAATMDGFADGVRPPHLPWAQAMWEYNRSNLVKYDPEGFCLPPGGPRSMGTPYPAEIIQDLDRIIIIFEGGGHVWREIHMDGREHPSTPHILAIQSVTGKAIRWWSIPLATTTRHGSISTVTCTATSCIRLNTSAALSRKCCITKR